MVIKLPHGGLPSDGWVYQWLGDQYTHNQKLEHYVCSRKARLKWLEHLVNTDVSSTIYGSNPKPIRMEYNEYGELRRAVYNKRD